MKYVCILLLIYNIFFFDAIYAQNEIVVSLATQNYEDLKVSFGKIKLDSSVAYNHAKAYLLKAKLNNDIIRRADGYYFLSRLLPMQTALKYCDSIIMFTKDIQNHEKYPAIAFENKGILYHDSGDFNKAFEFYLLALKYAQKNSFHYTSIKFNIAALKYRLGYREEAKYLFKNYLDELDRLNFPNKQYYYNRGLYAFSDALLYTKKLDSSEFIIKKGINLVANGNDEIIYARFILNSGINSFYKKDYEKALDSLFKSLNMIKSQKNDLTTAINHSYIGKSLYLSGDKTEGVKYLNKAHFFLERTNDVALELLDGYQFLIDYYRSKKDYENQFKYLNSLIRFDSIYDSKSKEMSQRITKSYEIPYLLSEKEELLQMLNQKNRISSNRIIVLVVFSIFLTLALLYYIRRNYVYKQRFKALMEGKPITKNLRSAKKENTSVDLKTKENLKKVSVRVLKQLSDFEKSNRFIDDYTLSALAKELNTNSTYLSKIINVHKGMNFSSYITKLRINYLIEEIKNSDKFDHYSTEGIALACGFKSYSPFATAFYKETGLRPSYFLKQVKKERKS